MLIYLAKHEEDMRRKTVKYISNSITTFVNSLKELADGYFSKLSKWKEIH